jgi:hypothetical protein
MGDRRMQCAPRNVIEINRHARANLSRSGQLASHHWSRWQSRTRLTWPACGQGRVENRAEPPRIDLVGVGSRGHSRQSRPHPQSHEDDTVVGQQHIARVEY